MPTILLVRGWRLFFYMNEGNEPTHIHARKAESECKFWISPGAYEIEEAWSYNLSPVMRREIRKIIFDHFDLICEEWRRVFGGESREGN